MNRFLHYIETVDRAIQGFWVWSHSGGRFQELLGFLIWFSPALVLFFFFAVCAELKLEGLAGTFGIATLMYLFVAAHLAPNAAHQSELRALPRRPGRTPKAGNQIPPVLPPSPPPAPSAAPPPSTHRGVALHTAAQVQQLLASKQKQLPSRFWQRGRNSAP